MEQEQSPSRPCVSLKLICLHTYLVCLLLLYLPGMIYIEKPRLDYISLKVWRHLLISAFGSNSIMLSGILDAAAEAN
jgi:hypothetical protein